MDYLKLFLKTYKAVPSWSLLHLQEGDEASGSGLAILDKDFSKLLAGITGKQMGNSDPRNVVLIMGDHGLNYDIWKNSGVGMINTKMPLLNILVPSWFMDRYPKVREILGSIDYINRK